MSTKSFKRFSKGENAEPINHAHERFSLLPAPGFGSECATAMVTDHEPGISMLRLQLEPSTVIVVTTGVLDTVAAEVINVCNLR